MGSRCLRGPRPYRTVQPPARVTRGQVCGVLVVVRKQPWDGAAQALYYVAGCRRLTNGAIVELDIATRINGAAEATAKEEGDGEAHHMELSKLATRQGETGQSETE